MFTSLEDLSARIDDPDLDVTPDDFWCCRTPGRCRASGMPEAGYLPIPQKLARAGVKDMVRISDARMSGTAYGSIVLHVTPDAASGGPLAKVKNGDRIRLSVKDRRIDLLVSPEELARRPSPRRPCPNAATRGSTATRCCKPTAAATSTSCARSRSGRGRFDNNMTVPDYQSLMLPVLYASSKGEVRVGDAINDIGDQLELTAEDRAILLPSGRQGLFENRVNWAKFYLGRAGLIELTRRGYFKITARGLQVLETNPARIDNYFLSKFEEFRQFKERRLRAQRRIRVVR